MPRSVEPWVGKTDDSVPPPRVYDRVFEDNRHCCHRCGRIIRPGERWTLEHRIALINGGANRETNLTVTCEWCLPIKNAEDAKLKAKNAAIRARHNGIKTAKRKIQSPGFHRPPSNAKDIWADLEEQS